MIYIYIYIIPSIKNGSRVEFLLVFVDAIMGYLKLLSEDENRYSKTNTPHWVSTSIFIFRYI